MSSLALRQRDRTHELADLGRRLMEITRDTVVYRAYDANREHILSLLDQASEAARELAPLDAALTVLAREKAAERQAQLDAQREQTRCKVAVAAAEKRARTRAELDEMRARGL